MIIAMCESKRPILLSEISPLFSVSSRWISLEIEGRSKHVFNQFTQIQVKCKLINQQQYFNCTNNIIDVLNNIISLYTTWPLVPIQLQLSN